MGVMAFLVAPILLLLEAINQITGLDHMVVLEFFEKIYYAIVMLLSAIGTIF